MNVLLPPVAAAAAAAATAVQEAEFDATADAPDGLNWLLRFAQERGKPFSVGE